MLLDNAQCVNLPRGVCGHYQDSLSEPLPLARMVSAGTLSLLGSRSTALLHRASTMDLSQEEQEQLSSERTWPIHEAEKQHNQTAYGTFYPSLSFTVYPKA